MAVIMIQGERHVVNQCETCAVWHTIPGIVYDCCKREGGFWHCPNGHSRGWAKGTDEAARRAPEQEVNICHDQTSLPKANYDNDFNAVSLTRDVG